MVQRTRSLASRVRLAALAILLGLTIVFGLLEVHSRRTRTRWQRPLEVAVALVQQGVIEPSVLQALRARFPTLEARLAAEYHRHGGTLERPVRLTVFGPVAIDRAPPDDPDDSLSSLVVHAYEQWRWTSAIDRGTSLGTRQFDSRIYLVMRAPASAARSFVEGSSEQGGRVGFARVELGQSSVDLALFVVAHELFHTLGANDKYDAEGRVLIPVGLVEPERVPLYPQRFADVMTRNLVLGPGSERPPDTLAELGVGPETARELAWPSSAPSK